MEERNFSNLMPPPRKIPLSLKLFLLFGGQSIVAWIFLPFITLFVTPFFGKTSKTTMKDAPLFAYVAFSVFPIVFLIMIIGGIIKGLKAIYLFENGMIAKAKLVNTETVIRRSGRSSYTAYIMTFEYEVAGQKLQTSVEVRNPRLLKDEANEPILYDQSNPEKAMLVDSLSTSVIIDDMGSFRQKYPVMGYLCALLAIGSACIVTYIFIGNFIK